jgi:hypothetical protein
MVTFQDMAICWIFLTGFVQQSRVPPELLTIGDTNPIQRWGRGMATYPGPAFSIMSSPLTSTPFTHQATSPWDHLLSKPLFQVTCLPMIPQARVLSLPLVLPTKSPHFHSLLKVTPPAQFLFRAASTGCSL